MAKNNNKNQIIIPNEVFPKPTASEISAAYILCDFFGVDVEFIPRNNCKTPDLIISGIAWELKTPTGDGKRNLQHTINRAIKQSQYIIIDVRFSKMHIAKIKGKLCCEIKKNQRIKRLLLIDKQKNVVEIFR